MSLNKKEMYGIYSYIRSKMSEEDMTKVKEKYSDFVEVNEEDNKNVIEKGILILIGKSQK